MKNGHQCNKITHWWLLRFTKQWVSSFCLKGRNVHPTPPQLIFDLQSSNKALWSVSTKPYKMAQDFQHSCFHFWKRRGCRGDKYYSREQTVLSKKSSGSTEAPTLALIKQPMSSTAENKGRRWWNWCSCFIRLAQMGLAGFVFHFHETSATFPGQHCHCFQVKGISKGLCIGGQWFASDSAQYPNLSQKKEFKCSVRLSVNNPIK